MNQATNAYHAPFLAGRRTYTWGDSLGPCGTAELHLTELRPGVWLLMEPTLGYVVYEPTVHCVVTDAWRILRDDHYPETALPGEYLVRVRWDDLVK